MLPYFHEYEKTLKEKEKIYIFRLRSFNLAEKNILEMNEDELSQFFTFSMTTNANVKSTLKLYLQWIKNTYNADIKNTFYLLSRLDTDPDYYDQYFFSLEELLDEVEQVEEETLDAYETPKSAAAGVEVQSNMIKAQEMFTRLKAVYIFLWHGLSYDDMTTVCIKDISEKGFFVPAWGEEVIIEPEYIAKRAVQILKDTEQTEYESKEGSNNLFKTDKVSILRNLAFLTFGGSCPDKRFYKNNVSLAGVYARLNRWEMLHNRELTSKDYDIVTDLSHGKIAKSQVVVKLNDYHKYLREL